ncbi:MAG: hypothetical protein R3E98_09250 [Gemmatimonadota bacterium]
MSDPTLRAGPVTAAAIAIGGMVLLAAPQHAASIVKVVVATAAVAAGLHALSRSVPATGWMSPFRWMSPFARGGGARRRRGRRSGTGALRARLYGWRQPIEGGPALPPAVLRALAPIARAALALDPRDPSAGARARAQLSPEVRAVLEAAPERRLRWYRAHPPAPRAVAEAVERILTDIDRAARGARGPRPPSGPGVP